jgi:hypothetical protein
MTGNQQGWGYVVRDTQHLWVWKGDNINGEWVDLIKLEIDLDNYYTKDETYNKLEVDADQQRQDDALSS